MLWLPITTNRYWLDRPQRDDLHLARLLAHALNPRVGRPRGATPSMALADMTALADRLAREDSDWNMGLGIACGRPLRRDHRKRGLHSWSFLHPPLPQIVDRFCSKVLNHGWREAPSGRELWLLWTALGEHASFDCRKCSARFVVSRLRHTSSGSSHTTHDPLRPHRSAKA